jgi:hypothetical protein
MVSRTEAKTTALITHVLAKSSARRTMAVDSTSVKPRPRKNWPFLYIQRPTLPSIYLALLAFVATLTLGVFLSLRARHPVRGQHAPW